MGSIYCLFSSTDGEPRYVGESSRDPDRRWKEHVASALDKQEQGSLCDWIRQVLRDGELVQYWVLQEDVAPVDLKTFEAYWIGQFGGLLNSNSTPETTRLGDDVKAAIRSALEEKKTG